jgi:hypothetical protein
VQRHDYKENSKDLQQNQINNEGEGDCGIKMRDHDL